MQDATMPNPVAAGAEPPAWGRVRPSRRIADKVLKFTATAFTLITVTVLFWILGMLIVQGGSSLSWAVFSQATPGPGSEGGGLANAIAGSFVLTLLGIAVATPVGLLAGTYLAEYGKGTKLAALIGFLNDILLSAPSILIGLFVYTLVVQPMGTYSGWAGAIALAIIALPVIVRTTDDMLGLVPGSLREAGVALGAPVFLVTRRVTWRAARAGIVTGILLALARIAGETAPLLFTALNNNSWFGPSLIGGIPNLPVTIFQFASAPYENWRQLAWAGALIITAAILLFSTIARYALGRDNAR